MGDRWLIRSAELSDVAEIAAAERICFTDPWSESGIREVLQSETTIGLVASISKARNRLAGYLFARAIGAEGEILNLAVVPEARGRGLGRLLLASALERLRGEGTEAVFLEVRESNRQAKSLYQSAGFRVVGVRADYYRSPREDALVLRRELCPAVK